MQPEILAPAGSPEAVTAAVRCGANAVYLGGKVLNARRNAANFTDEELKAVVADCHARGVKVYLTLNTLVGDAELPTAYAALQSACDAAVDALIVQDLGLAALARRVCSSMPLHASTQMSVQTGGGIRLLEGLGFTQAVLPRELTAAEIRAVRSETTCALECFVHGALCMCVSGQCLMSAVLGGRSGNRGLCAQPCRLPFGVNGGQGHALSLKDLSLVEELPALLEAGVTSFKIEGRMKRPEYVAAAVTACKNALAGTPDPEVSGALRAVFSRSGFTDGYYRDRRGPAMFGTREKDDVTSAAPVLASLRALYAKEPPGRPVQFTCTVRAAQPAALTAEAGGAAVTVTGDLPAPAQTKALTEETLRTQLSKCGGTPFFADSIQIRLDPGLFLSAGALNALRRDALTQLEAALLPPPKPIAPAPSFSFARHIAEPPAIHLRVRSEAQLPADLSQVHRVILPLSAAPDTVARLAAQGIETAAELPAGVFSNAGRFAERLRILRGAGLALAVASNPDGVAIAKKAGLPFSCGFGMNLYNTLAVEEAAHLGATDCLLSCELTLAAAQAIGGDLPRGLLVYGRLPLMLTRNCPVRTKLDCAACGGESVLTDRMGVSFPVVCGDGCSQVLNSRPLWLSDRLANVRNLDYYLVYCTVESADEAAAAVRACRVPTPPPAVFTRGLYFKGVE
ncbi:MAG: U32 family peptidase [Clostridia bacterium]|nr:U32 family peptidase [Clostridia bacterium]